ncbi:hypothetical protein BGZ51_001544 [Haplosporangium sp. Z 767]|nr:hypothetical protein BGZ50_004253 [Haplosporangium sp. Z 11]KAF9187094.1 hypothetical protein BGZ51_001544 [Haplosporangium sp. Z 767]
MSHHDHSTPAKTKESLAEKLTGVALETEDRQQHEKDLQHTMQQQHEHWMREHGLPEKTESTLNCCVDFALYPLGTDIPFSSFIDKVEKVLKRSGIKYKVNKQSTTMEGNMMEIMYAIKCCHDAAHASGCPRIATNVRIESGTDKYK